MIGTKHILVFSICLVYSISSEVEFGDEDDQTIKDYVEERGYTLEPHQITTSDGYVLVYHRVSVLNSSSSESRPPVLLQHGLGLSSAAFLTPDKDALAYVLVDAGYDVWLANSRGNRYSRRHLSLNSSDEEFWRFSFHELAVEDMSAAVVYILHTTGKSRLHFVGHSHGGAFILALLASKPHYQPILASVTTLAPATFLSSGHIRTVIETLYKKSKQYEAEGRFHIFSKPDEFNKMFIDEMQNSSKVLDIFTRGTMDEGVWRDVLQFQPSGTSTEMIHYVYQQIENGQIFKHHNYGMESNLSNYNSTETSIYKLSTIANPISIIFSDSDLVISQKDIQHHVRLLEKVSFIRINIGNPNHMDFLWNPKVKSIVNKEIIQIIKREEAWPTKLTQDNFDYNLGGENINDILDSGGTSGEDSCNGLLIKEMYQSFIDILMNYELKTDSSLLYAFLASNASFALKFKVLNEVIPVLFTEYTETNRIMLSFKSLIEQINSVPSTDENTTLNSYNRKFPTVTCPSYLLREEFINKYDKLQNIDTGIGSLFSYSFLKSKNLSNTEKIKLVKLISYYLIDNCEEHCMDIIELNRETNEVLGQIKNFDVIDTINLPGSYQNSDKKIKRETNHEIDKIINKYSHILKTMINYESITHSPFNHSSLVAINQTNKEMLHTLRHIIVTLNNLCTSQCDEIHSTAVEIENLYNLAENPSNSEPINISKSSILGEIETTNNETFDYTDKCFKQDTSCHNPECIKTCITKPDEDPAELTNNGETTLLDIPNSIETVDTGLESETNPNFVPVSNIYSNDQSSNIDDTDYGNSSDTSISSALEISSSKVSYEDHNSSSDFEHSREFRTNNEESSSDELDIFIKGEQRYTQNANCTISNVNCDIPKHNHSSLLYNKTTINHFKSENVDNNASKSVAQSDQKQFLLKEELLKVFKQIQMYDDYHNSLNISINISNSEFVELLLNKVSELSTSCIEECDFVKDVELQLNNIKKLIDDPSIPVINSFNCTPSDPICTIYMLNNQIPIDKNRTVVNAEKGINEDLKPMEYYDIEQSHEMNSLLREVNEKMDISIEEFHDDQQSNCTESEPDCGKTISIGPITSLPEDSYHDGNIMGTTNLSNYEISTNTSTGFEKDVETSTSFKLTNSSEEDFQDVLITNCTDIGLNCYTPSLIIGTSSTEQVTYSAENPPDSDSANFIEADPNFDNSSNTKLHQDEPIITSKEYFHNECNNRNKGPGSDCESPTSINTSVTEPFSNVQGNISATCESIDTSQQIDSVERLNCSNHIQNSLQNEETYSSQVKSENNKTAASTWIEEKDYQQLLLSEELLKAFKQIQKYDSNHSFEIPRKLSNIEIVEFLLNRVSELIDSCTEECDYVKDFELQLHNIKKLIDDPSIPVINSFNCTPSDPICTIYMLNNQIPIDKNRTVVNNEKGTNDDFEPMEYYDNEQSHEINYLLREVNEKMDISIEELHDDQQSNCTEYETDCGKMVNIGPITSLPEDSYHDGKIMGTTNLSNYEISTNTSTGFEKDVETSTSFKLINSSEEDFQDVLITNCTDIGLNCNAPSLIIGTSSTEQVTYSAENPPDSDSANFIEADPNFDNSSNTKVHQDELIITSEEYFHNECNNRNKGSASDCESPTGINTSVTEPFSNVQGNNSATCESIDTSQQIDSVERLNCSNHIQNSLQNEETYSSQVKSENNKTVTSTWIEEKDYQQLLLNEELLKAFKQIQKYDSNHSFEIPINLSNIEIFEFLLNRVSEINDSCTEELCVYVKDFELQLHNIMKLLVESPVVDSFNCTPSDPICRKYMLSNLIPVEENRTVVNFVTAISEDLEHESKPLEYNEQSQDINPLYREVRELYVKVIQDIMHYLQWGDLEFISTFFESDNIASLDKVNTLLIGVKELQNKCVALCEEIEHIVNRLETVLSMIRNIPSSKQIIISGRDVRSSSENYDQIKELESFHWETQKRKELINIIQSLIEYESKTNSGFNYTVLVSSNISSNEMNIILNKRIEYIKETCVDNCKSLNDIEKGLGDIDKQVERNEINKIVQYIGEYESKINSNFNYTSIEYSNISTTEFFIILFDRIKYIKETCGEACESINYVIAELELLDKQTERKELNTIVKLLINQESMINSNYIYSFMNLTNTNSRAKIMFLFEIITNMTVLCSTNRNELHFLESELKRLDNQIEKKELIKIVIKLLVFERKVYSNFSYSFMDSVGLSSSEIYIQLYKRIRYIKETCSGSCEGLEYIASQLEHLDKQTERKELYKFVQRLMEHESRIHSHFSYSVREFANISISAINNILNKRIMYIKQKCVIMCEDVYELEKELQIFDKQAEIKEILKVVIKLLSFESKVQSKFSYSIVDYPDISIPEIGSLLLKRIKYLKELCSENCVDINNFESVVKNIDRHNKMRELYAIVQKLENFESTINSKFSYSFMESDYISVTELAGMILKRIRYIQEKCVEGCDGISDLELKVLYVYKHSGLPTYSNYSKIYDHDINIDFNKHLLRIFILVEHLYNDSSVRELKKLINQLNEYDLQIKTDLNNTSDLEILRLLLQRITHFNNTCNKWCEDLNEIGTKIEKIYLMAVHSILLSSIVDADQNKSRIFQFITKEKYIEMLLKIYSYDLKFKIYPLIKYVSSKEVSDTEMYDIMFKRLLLIEHNCLESCEEIHKLAKQMKLLRFQFQSVNNITRLNLTDYVVPSSVQINVYNTSDIYLNPEYHLIQEEYFKIVELLKNYERSNIKNIFNYSILVLPEMSSSEKIRLLSSRSTFLNSHCVGDCSEIHNLDHKMQNLLERINFLKEFHLDDIDLSPPKLTYRSWLNSENNVDGLLIKVQEFIRRINVTYFAE